jgi:hypothetical protein
MQSPAKLMAALLTAVDAALKVAAGARPTRRRCAPRVDGERPGHAALDLANGDRFTVAAATPTAVTLTDGPRTVELSADPIQLDHAYTTTIHASQCTTAERVLIDAATRTRSTTSQDVYYDATSLARQEGASTSSALLWSVHEQYVPSRRLAIDAFPTCVRTRAPRVRRRAGTGTRLP